MVAAVMAGSGLPVQANPSGAAPSAAGLERLSGFFENEVTTGKLAGAVVLIQQHGRPVYFRSFGVRNCATKLPMTPDTIFAVHSMTKPITSLAAMMLIDQGRLALADPVSRYIPAFAAVKVGVDSRAKDGTPVLKPVRPNRPVTIQDLLRHTSGITYDYIGSDLIKNAYSDANIFEGPFNNGDFAERVARLPLARQPGTLWRYGHSTDVLGRIIEIVAGKSLFSFLISTITDYARFAQMLLNRGKLDGKQYLSPAAFRQMTSDQIGPGSGVMRDYFYFPGDGFGYGYGVAVRTDPGNARPPPPGSIGELKWDSGSGTYFGVDPKLDMLYILMEQTQPERGRIVPAFRKLVYDAFGRLPAAQAEAAPNNAVARPAPAR